MSEVQEPSVEISKAEAIKVNSRGLRGSLLDEIQNTEIKKFSHDNEQLLKFHGMYQQKDRDRRTPGERHLGPKPFTLMLRGRIPGGRLSAKQWIAWDEAATRYSSEGLRLTTRQSIQLHGVAKGEVQSVVRRLTEDLITSTGACGDVVRNVMQPPNPWLRADLAQLDEVAELLSEHFKTKTKAYTEIFVDGVLVASDEPEDDPIYGRAYLPRKFKIAVTKAGENAVDLFTQDLSFAAEFDGTSKIQGYFVYAGGGMGMSHGKEETFPRLADYLGFVPADELVNVAEAIVTTQRDFGDRSERAHARLKYTIADRGVEWFVGEVQRRSKVLFESRSEPKWKTPSYLGWHRQSDGKLSLGFHILSGRIKDSKERPLKTAIRQIVERYGLTVQVTAEQDIVLNGIHLDSQVEIEEYLRELGITAQAHHKLFDRALTCVALPMCVKALAEAERAGPETFSVIAQSLDQLDLSDRSPTIRITGCPNGCARPYAAEIGLVGQMPGKYSVYLGGHPEGTRLGFKVLDKKSLLEIFEALDRLFRLWKRIGSSKELLGDFVQRIDRQVLSATLAVETGKFVGGGQA